MNKEAEAELAVDATAGAGGGASNFGGNPRQSTWRVLSDALAVVGLTIMSGCGPTGNDLEKFKKLCRETAQVQILDGSAWMEYLEALRSEYKAIGLDPLKIRVEPANRFRVKSTSSDRELKTYLKTLR